MSTVHVAVYDGLADWELGHVSARINAPDFQREPGRWRVRTVGLTTAPVRTLGGLTVVPDQRLADLDPADGELLVLPGSDGYERGELGAFEDVAAGFVAAGVPVAGICGATFGLARAGLLDDRRHTSNAPAFLARTGYAGAAHYVVADAVTDRDVITAPATRPAAFAREVLARLGVFEPAVLAAWFARFGHPATA